MQERLLELQFEDIQERNQTTQIRDLVKIQKKDGHQSKLVNWKGCHDPVREIMSEDSQRSSSVMTEYGVLRCAPAFSQIRTHLDSFLDTEAYALMHSGYQQTRFEVGIS